MKLNDLDDVTITTPATVVNYYHYDGNGMRYCKTDSSGTTYYTYDGLNPILERDGSGAVQVHYTHGRSDIAGIGSLTVAKRNGSHQYPHMDQIGSVRNLTDDSETVVQYYEYDAFGNELESAGRQTNPIRYSSHILDEDTELIYNFARMYDAEAGRFVSRDRSLEDVNAYVYIHSCPVHGVDPLGLQGMNLGQAYQIMERRREEERARRMEEERREREKRLGHDCAREIKVPRYESMGVTYEECIADYKRRYGILPQISYAEWAAAQVARAAAQWGALTIAQGFMDYAATASGIGEATGMTAVYAGMISYAGYVVAAGVAVPMTFVKTYDAVIENVARDFCREEVCPKCGR